MNNEKKQIGSIEIIMGCMFSGKTSYLLNYVNKLSSIGIKPLIINSEVNTRDQTGVLNNHNNETINCITVKKLSDLQFDILNSHQYIFIDEGQFFEDLKDTVLEWCEEVGKNVYIFGLDGDFRRNKFGAILDLIPYADNVIKLTGYCSQCNNKTPSLFTFRKSSDTEQTVIGNGDKYIPLCRKHYLMNSQIM